MKNVMRHDPLVVGVIASVVTAGNTALLGLPLSPHLLVAALAGAALVYWSDRVLGFSPEDQHAHPDRVVWVEQHRRWLYLEGAVVTVVLAASLPFLALETLAVAALCGALGLVHVIPVLPGRRRWKAFGRGRAVTIALAWAVGSVLLPWTEAGMPSGLAHELSVMAPGGLVLAQTLIVYANVIVAGWADGPGDARAGMPVVRRSGVEVRRRAAGWALAGGLVVLLLGALTIPMALAVGYALGAAGLAGLLAQLRPQETPLHMLWLDLAVTLPAVLVLALHWGLG